MEEIQKIIRSQMQGEQEIDLLTGLYSIQTFFSSCEELYRSDLKNYYAIIRFDIYQFKMVNEFCGWEEGSSLLKYLGDLFQKCVGKEGLCSHYRADIFVMCIPYKREHELHDIINYMLKKVFDYPLSCRIIPSFGVCLVDDNTIGCAVYCDCADLAIRTIKGNVMKNCAFYDSRIKERMLYEKKIENEMDEALNKKEFQIFIQPKVRLCDGKIVGGETLVRWKHPVRGLLAPSNFLDIFERNGFIIKMDEYIWEQTFRKMQQWFLAGRRVLPISLNISRMHAYKKNLADKIISLANKFQVPPSCIVLELTESAFLENIGEMLDQMKRLQKYGFSFSMDDFGSGYSSINMLAKIAVNEVKMDHTFLKEKTLGNRTQVIFYCSYQMMKQLGASVVAEGVETKEQIEFLKQFENLVVQGYYYYKPMPIEAYERLVYLR